MPSATGMRPLPDPMPDYFFDTVCLSNFALVKHLDILVTRYGNRTKVTQQVSDELVDGVVAGYSGLLDIETAIQKGKFGKVVSLTEVEKNHYRSLIRTLGSGEASCVACSIVRAGIVATDDRNARQACLNEHVRFTGTIGILKACVLDNTFLLADADEILQRMIREGYHSPVTSIGGLV